MKSFLTSGMRVGSPRPEPGAGELAPGQRERALHELEALAVALLPGVEPDVDAVLHVGDDVPGHERAGREQHGAHRQPAHTLGRHPQQHDEQGEEQQRGAHVLLADEDHERRAPGDEQRPEVAGLGEVERPHLPRAGGQQLPPLRQVGGEEEGERELGELSRLEVDRPDADPQPRAVGRREADAGHEGQQQEHDADEGEGPLVPGEVGHPPDDEEGGDVGADGHQRPRRLQPGQVGVDAGDHHVAQPVEQRGQREQRAVRAGRERPGGQVGDEEQAEDDDEERRQVGRQRRGAAERGEDVGARRDDGGEDDQPELRRASDLRDHGAMVTTLEADPPRSTVRPPSSWSCRRPAPAGSPPAARRSGGPPRSSRRSGGRRSGSGTRA